MTKIYRLLTLVLFLTSCTDSTVILKNRNFDNGDWLLVNTDHYKKTMFIIDDEKILKENSEGIHVKFSEENSYTTCDGSLKLYKNGELIVEQDYLDHSRLTQSKAIKEAYKRAKQISIHPKDNSDFNMVWDSLKNTSKNYPTRYHLQPADKDIIWNYKYE